MDKITCKNCKKETSQKRYKEDLFVCHHCGFHDYISAQQRLEATVDRGSFKEIATDLRSQDFLNFIIIGTADTMRALPCSLRSLVGDELLRGDLKSAFNKARAEGIRPSTIRSTLNAIHCVSSIEYPIDLVYRKDSEGLVEIVDLEENVGVDVDVYEGKDLSAIYEDNKSIEGEVREPFYNVKTIKEAEK